MAPNPPELAVGKLHDWLAFPLELPSLRQEVSFEPHVLRVRELTATQATVELDATRTVDASAGGSTSRRLDRIRGPVVLENRDGRWRIVDYELDGSRMLDAIDLDARTAQERDGVRVQVLAAARGARWTTVVLAIANETADDVSIRRVAARRGWSWVGVWADPGLRIGPREQRVTRVGWLHGQPTLRLALTLAAGSKLLHFDLTPRAGVDLQPPPRRVPRGLRPQKLWRALAPLAVTLAVLGAFAPDFLPGLLLAVAAGFAWSTLTSYRRVGRRALRRGLAFTLPALVASAVLWSGNTESALSACGLFSDRAAPPQGTTRQTSYLRSLCRLATRTTNCVAYLDHGEFRFAAVRSDCRWFRWRTELHELI